MKTRRSICASFVLIAGVARAAAPADEYAWRFPLHLDAGADVHLLTLTPEIYRSTFDIDLRDLRVVTASGEDVGFGPLPRPELERWREMPWALQRLGMVFEPMPSLENGELAKSPASRDGDFGLKLAPGEYAARLSMNLQSNAVETVPILALRIAWSASDALPEHTRWWVVDPRTDQAIYPERSHQRFDASQSRGETRLVFRGLDLHAFNLRAQAVPSSLGIDQVEAEYDPDPEQYRHSVALVRQTYADQTDAAFGFRMDGPYPVHAAQIELAGEGIAQVRLMARDVSAPQWQELGSMNAFDLQVDDTQLVRNRIRFFPTRQRQWLLIGQPKLAAPPRLRMYYLPDRFLITHRGPADLFLLAGHRRSLRPHYPVDTVMSELQQRFGDRWMPQPARVGAREQVAGAQALLPPAPPLPYRRWLLWALLVGAAALIAWMALGLLRESKPASGNDA